MNAEDKRIAPPLRITAVDLRLVDPPRTAGFYRRIFGLPGAEDPAAPLTIPGQTAPILGFPPGRGAGRPDGPGLFHTAFKLPDRASLAAWLRHYIELGAPHWQGAADHGVSEALYLADPEGNGIEIYRDRDPEEWPRASGGELEMGTDPLDLEELSRFAADRQIGDYSCAWEIGHVHLQVADIATAERFYCGTLGFEPMQRYGSDALFVSAGGYHHHLGLNTWRSLGATPRTAEEPGLAGVSFRLSSPAEEERLRKRIETGDIAYTEENGGLRVRDPFGIELIFFADDSLRG